MNRYGLSAKTSKTGNIDSVKGYKFEDDDLVQTNNVQSIKSLNQYSSTTKTPYLYRSHDANALSSNKYVVDLYEYYDNLPTAENPVILYNDVTQKEEYTIPWTHESVNQVEAGIG